MSCFHSLPPALATSVTFWGSLTKWWEDLTISRMSPLPYQEGRETDSAFTRPRAQPPFVVPSSFLMRARLACVLSLFLVFRAQGFGQGEGGTEEGMEEGRKEGMEEGM